MASVAKRIRDGKVSWLARWRDLDGVQRKRSFPRKVDAERYLATISADLVRGTYVDPSGGKVTFGAWAEGWLDSQGHLKETTRERYAGLLRRHLVPAWGRRPLSAISHDDVTRWVTALKGEGLSASTIRQAHRVLALVLEHAARDGRLSRNPAHRVPLPRVVRGEPRYLTPSQIVAMSATAGPAGVTLRTLAMTGLRFGELAALRVGRVDLERRRLSVVESVTEVGGELVWSTTKTHQARSVPVAGSLVGPLREACTGKSAGDLVFTSPRGGPLRIGNWRTRVFDPAARAAGVEGITPHDLRHTAASLAVSSGANVKALQRMLGHASAAMTLDVYAALFDADLDGVADGMDALVPPMCPEPAGVHDSRPSDQEN